MLRGVTLPPSWERRVVMHWSFFFPLLAFACWVHVLSTKYVELPEDVDPQRATRRRWDLIRFGVVASGVAARLLGLRWHMQAYLTYVTPHTAALATQPPPHPPPRAGTASLHTRTHTHALTHRTTRTSNHRAVRRLVLLGEQAGTHRLY